MIRSVVLGLTAVLVACAANPGASAVPGATASAPASATASATNAPEPRTWDAVADFRSGPNQLNPSPDSYGNPGVWSYMRGPSPHDPASYELLPRFEPHGWLFDEFTGPYVGLGALDGTLYLIPMNARAIGSPAVLRWTSPITGDVAIDGRVFRPADACDDPSGSVTLSVDHAGESLTTVGPGLGQSVGFQVVASVATGDSIYFIVEAGPGTPCQVTLMRIEITDA